MLIGLLWITALPATAQAPLKREPVHFDIPAWFRTSFLDLREDLKEITAENKRLALFLHQDGCPFCARFINETLAEPEVQAYFRARFDAVEMNVWGAREVTDINGNVLTEKQFAAGMRVIGTPTLFFYNAQGEMILRLSGYYPPERFMQALRQLENN